jgi:hypothetical protein
MGKQSTEHQGPTKPRNNRKGEDDLKNVCHFILVEPVLLALINIQGAS